ncbi:hypothetical protein BH18ACI4_BH18ACI4_12240 [soil metagenome]
MMAHGSSVESGIDADEEYAQVMLNNVANSLALSCEDLFSCGFPWSGY